MTPSDVKIVAENINDFIEVPDGINRLRKAVLTLALSGQLVPQDISEGTAEQLYFQIQEKRKELEQSGVNKKTKELLPVVTEEIPFDIPKSWKWIRLGSVVNVQTGTLDANAANPNGDYPFFTCADEPLKINRFAYDCECVLLAGNGNFNVKYYKGKFEAYQRTYIIEASNNGLFVPFLFYLVQSQTDRFKASSLGSAMPYIRLGYITEAVVALPPYAEQKRIVEKVQSVMKQLDELESRKNERDLIRSRLTRSAMQALGSADSKVALEQLTELIKVNSDIDELEKAIRSLSVFGYLTNTPSQEDVPSDWRWTDWGDLLSEDKYSMKRGPFGSALRKDFFVPDGIKVYEQYNAIHDVDRERYFISDEKYKELEAFTVRPGDLIISCSGTLGRIAELHKDSKIGIINQALLKISLNQALVSNEYFILLFRSDFIQKRIYEEALGTAMTNMVNVKTLKKIALPIPPLEEQQRIVKKFNEMKRMLDNLKTIVSN